MDHKKIFEAVLRFHAEEQIRVKCVPLEEFEMLEEPGDGRRLKQLWRKLYFQYRPGYLADFSFRVKDLAVFLLKSLESGNAPWLISLWEAGLFPVPSYWWEQYEIVDVTTAQTVCVVNVPPTDPMRSMGIMRVAREK